MLYLGSPSLCSFPRPRSSGPASPRLIFDLKAVTWGRKDRSLHLLGSSVPAAKRRSGLDLNPQAWPFFPLAALYDTSILYFFWSVLPRGGDLFRDCKTWKSNTASKGSRALVQLLQLHRIDIIYHFSSKTCPSF
ncbi:hypothetical protein M440DRAFT_1150033 [Trichoderma longibrachiatum ATCC 18648]|uniref:Uncharacterized protein n=1 Tax=Trichoderma longibrachiatum ATCC 18648 TaxID=983965 RepID=A0A2T4BQ21_TRILO|nr:hypothetical protein M440DRAFT_1150033 [Trichoderma longibrachiatum ATCC 18648]